jgi:hypothetical protein
LRPLLLFLDEARTREVGRGSIDFPGVLRAATEAGVIHFFAEQDKAPGNSLDSLKISNEYLRKVAFRLRGRWWRQPRNPDGLQCGHER